MSRRPRRRSHVFLPFGPKDLSLPLSHPSLSPRGHFPPSAFFFRRPERRYVSSVRLCSRDHHDGKLLTDSSARGVRRARGVHVVEKLEEAEKRRCVRRVTRLILLGSLNSFSGLSCMHAFILLYLC